jgi:hypothetical protein
MREYCEHRWGVAVAVAVASLHHDGSAAFRAFRSCGMWNRDKTQLPSNHTLGVRHSSLQVQSRSEDGEGPVGACLPCRTMQPHVDCVSQLARQLWRALECVRWGESGLLVPFRCPHTLSHEVLCHQGPSFPPPLSAPPSLRPAPSPTPPLVPLCWVLLPLTMCAG